MTPSDIRDAPVEQPRAVAREQARDPSSLEHSASRLQTAQPRSESGASLTAV